MTPVLMKCFYCGNECGVALFSKDPGCGCIDQRPCKACEEIMAKYVLLIGCAGGPEARTGQMWAVQDTDVPQLFSDQAAVEAALRHRCAFIDAAAVEALKLPAKQVDVSEKIENLVVPDYPAPIEGEERSHLVWQDKRLCRRHVSVAYNGNTLNVRYGWTRFGEQDPYISVVADEVENGVVVQSGAIHDAVAEAVPGLLRLLRWHLCSVTEPMHYTADGLYWWQVFRKRSKWKADERQALKHFASTIVFGACEDDAERIREVETDEEVRHWLETRRPNLMQALWADSQAYHLDTVKEDGDDPTTDQEPDEAQRKM